MRWSKVCLLEKIATAPFRWNEYSAIEMVEMKRKCRAVTTVRKLKENHLYDDVCVEKEGLARFTVWEVRTALSLIFYWIRTLRSRRTRCNADEIMWGGRGYLALGFILFYSLAILKSFLYRKNKIRRDSLLRVIERRIYRTATWNARNICNRREEKTKETPTKQNKSSLSLSETIIRSVSSLSISFFPIHSSARITRDPTSLLLFLRTYR